MKHAINRFASFLCAFAVSSSVFLGFGQSRISNENLVTKQRITKISTPLKTEYPISPDPQKATIIFTVEKDWGNGTGYQLLMDFDFDTYGRIFRKDYASDNKNIILTADENGIVDYSDFEVKLPENAYGDPACTDAVIIAPNSTTLLVDPGSYDYMVTRPVPGEKVYVADGEKAIGDNITFAAGSVYAFTIISTETGDECIFGKVHPVDLAITELIIPETSELLGSEETISIKVKNKGLEAVSSFTAQYSINEGTPIEETVNVTIEPQEEYTYTFTHKADLSAPGDHKIIADILVESDENTDNNSMEKSIYHVVPQPLPYSNNFNSVEKFNLWRVENLNNDNRTWEFKEGKDADEKDGGFARSYYSMSKDMDENLVMKDPLMMEEGPHYINFRYTNGSKDMETLVVLYGTSREVSEMTVIDTLEFTQSEDGSWHMGDYNIDIKQAGNYYFAFRACSKANTYYIALDNVIIDTGSFNLSPDIAIDKVILPVSNCNLDSAKVGAVVSNVGTADIRSFKMSYDVNGETIFEQVFDSLLAGTADTLYFTQAFQLVEMDLDYKVTVKAFDLSSPGAKAEVDTSNNKAEAIVVKHSPRPLPFITDFSNPDEPLYWTGEGWTYNDEVENTYTCYIKMSPFISRCVTLEKDIVYSFGLEYRSGVETMGLITEDWAIIYGATGTDIRTWDTLINVSGDYTYNKYVLHEKSFQVDIAGEYNFAIIDKTAHGSFYIKGATIKEMIPYDVCLTGFSGPTMVPTEHLSAEEGILVNVSIRNAGIETLDNVKVDFNTQDNISMGSHTMSLGQAGTTVNEEFDINGKFDAGKELIIKAKAEPMDVDEEDTTPDNTKEIGMLVSDSVLAYDHVTDEMLQDKFYSAGTAGGNITAASLFSIRIQDTLTGAIIGWNAEADGQEVEIGIWKYNAEDGSGQKLYTSKGTATQGGAWKTYEFPGLILEPGDYMLTAKFSGYILTVDNTDDGLVYILMDNKYFAQQEDLGFPSMRAVFGQGAIPVTKDLAAVSFIHPSHDGLYSSKENVIVEIQNNGFEKTNGKVHLWVNKTKVDPVDVEVASYGKAQVSFVADLSERNHEYILTAIVEAEGDINPDNDSCTFVLSTPEEADPYILDFELCADFSTGNFNPAWTTVDVDAAPTYGFSGVDFPGSDGAFAFMAFNPQKTEPSLMNVGGTMFTPYQGDKYGASFCSSSGTNNDWLVSPKLILPQSGAHLSFYAKGASDEYGKEKFNVLVSEIDQEIESFTQIHSGEVGSNDWNLVDIDLEKYNGKSVYIAIQCVSEDAYVFMIDDIRISKPTANDFQPEDLPIQVSVSPNPASDRIWIHTIATHIHRIQIFNTSGVMVYENGQMSQNNFSINVSGWTPGIYFARIQTDQGCVVKKIVVE